MVLALEDRIDRSQVCRGRMGYQQHPDENGFGDSAERPTRRNRTLFHPTKGVDLALVEGDTEAVDPQYPS